MKLSEAVKKVHGLLGGAKKIDSRFKVAKGSLGGSATLREFGIDLTVVLQPKHTGATPAQDRWYFQTLTVSVGGHSWSPEEAVKLASVLTSIACLAAALEAEFKHVEITEAG